MLLPFHKSIGSNNNRKLVDGATAFNQPLAGWDVSKVENMQYMFLFTRSFNRPLIDDHLHVSNFNIEKRSPAASCGIFHITNSLQ
jgi:hypothetical protein